MKKIILSIISITLFSTVFSQNIDYNLDNGYIAGGYDVVAYFSNKATEGKSNYTSTHQGVKYKFSNQANLNKFKANPDKYTPQYGGWCAYAIGAKNKKVDIDPETFEIRDGKLYLFYNSWGTNTLDSWLEEKPEQLKAKADKNWGKLRLK